MSGCGLRNGGTRHSGGAKHKATRKKSKAVKTFSFQKPIFKGKKNMTNENIIIMAALPATSKRNITMKTMKKKKSKAQMEPEEYLEKVSKFLDKLTDDVSSMSKAKFERHEFVAVILMQELDDVLKSIGAELHIDENEGDVFAYVDALEEVIEDKLEDFDDIKNNVSKAEEKFMMRAEMAYLASSIDDAIKKAKEQYNGFVKSASASSMAKSASSKSSKSSKSNKSSKSANMNANNNMMGLIQGLKATSVGDEMDELTAMMSKIPSFK